MEWIIAACIGLAALAFGWGSLAAVCVAFYAERVEDIR